MPGMGAGARANWQIDLLTVGHNRPGTPFGAGLPNGLVVHSTDDPDATAKNIRNYFEGHPEAEASAHAAVDWKEVRILVPLLLQPEIAWHAGPTANHRFLGIEICEPSDPALWAPTYANALEMLAEVLRFHRWPVNENYVWSHALTSATWHETDHMDPLAFFARHEKTWVEFMADLAAAVSAWPST